MIAHSYKIITTSTAQLQIKDMEAMPYFHSNIILLNENVLFRNNEEIGKTILLLSLPGR